MTNKVILVGEGSLYIDFRETLEQAGYEIYQPENMFSTTGEVGMALEIFNLDLNKKKKAVQELDHMLDSRVPILSSTLAITATEAASWTKNPERVVGFGTLAPLSERLLVEVVSALQTDDIFVQKVSEFFGKLNKEVEIVEDEAGLVFPRILSLIINEAAFTAMEKTASLQDIDIAMKKGTNYPYGPLEWADRIGLDDVLAVIYGLHRETREERYRPASLLRKLVLAGRTGIRTGRGFYQYEQAGVVNR
ncbi:3-hydroxyacyl-CoA dehydrogenase family protein [Aneurinibacillus sp. REN35]|uniref:3-hydroxyacyl-CoA dehydrogenase family protein n=1 Tax=Aneurinibacillus sp. REN35 TaxID=3237286 RepID=UPI00352926A9